MPAVVAPIAGFFSAIASTTIGSIALNLLSSVALSALSRALAPDAKPVGIRTENTLSGGITPEAFMLGASATGGTFVCPPMSHGNAGKTPNAFLTYVIELAGIPGHQLDGLILNGERVEILTDSPHADYGQRIGGTYDGKAWIRYHDGTQTAADAMLLAKYPAPFVRPWSADMIGTGLCYAVLTFQYDREVFQGWPQCRFELSSVPLYDPRRDSTAGGSGSHRWGQPATYEPSNNVAVQLYNAKRGLTFPSGDVWGGGIPAEDLPIAAWMAEMDACDDPVDDGNGGTEPAFRSGIEVQAADEPFSVIEELLKACMGSVAETGGVWTLRTGAPRLPVLFITDDDIIADEPEDFAPFPPIDQIFNAITATHPDPAAMWESRESELRTNATWEAEDGGRRLQTSLSLPTVPYAVQVDRICAALIADHRRMRRHVMTLDTPGAVLEAGDTIAWTSASNSYTAKLFEVTELSRDLRTQLVRASLREVDPGDYDVPEGLVRPNPPLPDPVRPAPQSVPGFAVSPYILELEGTERRAGIRAQWDPDGADDARGLRIAVRRTGEVGAGTEQPLYQIPAGSAVIVDGLVPGEYQVRARLRVNRRTAWTDWLSVTVADVRLGLEDLTDDLVNWLGNLQDWIDGGVVDLPEIIGAIYTDLTARANEIIAETEARVALAQATAENLRAQRDRIRAVAAEVLEAGSHNHLAREELRRVISVQIEAVTASFDQQIFVLITETGSLAARVTSIEAETADLVAEISTVDLARIQGDEALAQMVTAMSVGTATQFDQARVWYWDAAVEDWTGSPAAPSVTALGWLRPGAASSALSPAGLAISGGAYKQVRARIRRVGTPVWLGQLWWAGSGETWDAGRRITLAEPAFDDDIALLTWAPEWTGVIDSIRVDLAAGADELNYYELDWLAIGRPAPGASSSELLAERLARIEGDKAEAASRELLETRLTDTEGVASGAASAATELAGRVTSTEEGIEAVAGRTTTLEASVNDEETGLAATAAALDQLVTQVEALDDGSQVLLAQALRNLRTELRRAALETAEAGAQGELGAQQTRQYIADATQILSTRIEATDDAVRVVSEAITLLQAGIEGLADSTALQELSASIEDLGAEVSSQASAITSLNNTVNHPDTGLGSKASSSAVSGLTGRVSAVEGSLSSQSGAITELENIIGHEETGLGSKVSSTAFDALNSLVTDDETGLAAIAQRVTDLRTEIEDDETGLGSKVASTAFDALNSQVTDDETGLAAIAQRVTDLRAEIEDDETGLGSKVSSTAFDALNSLVTDDETGLAATAQQVTSLNTTITAPTTGLSAVRSLAEGKGKVFYRNTPPIVAERLGQNLWVDTSGGANTPKRWNGADWVPVTDKVATDAAADAAAALSQVAGKASSTAFDTLNSQVQHEETGLAATAQRVTNLKSQIDHPDTGLSAVAGAVSNLSTRVEETEDGLAAVSNAATIVQAAIEGSSLIANGDFAGGLLTGWTNVAAGMSVLARDTGSSVAARATAPTPFVLQIAQNAANQSADVATAVPVTAGALLRASLQRASSGGTRNVTLQIVGQFLDAAGAAVGAPQVLLATTTGATAWGRVTGEAFAVPSGAVSVTLQLVRVGGGAGVGWATGLRVERDGMAVDAITASGLFRMEAVAGVGGGTRIGMVGRTSVAEVYREAGLYIDVPVNPALPARVAVSADQFMIFGPDGSVVPFIIDGDRIYLTGSAIRLTGDTEVDGTFTIGSSSAEGRLEIVGDGVFQYDGAGNRRVVLGKLS